MKRHDTSNKPASRLTPVNTNKIPAGAWIRLGCIGILWLLLCYLLISSQPLTLWLIFTIIASGIIVFVPLYKKYMRNAKD